MSLHAYNAVETRQSINTSAADGNHTQAYYSKPASKFPQGGHWIIDPKKPGADIPPVGLSLFDLIFSHSQEGSLKYHIPYPFAELVERIRLHLMMPDDALKQVMFPIGRSLRRHSAAPDYFESPRFVIAAEGEPLTSVSHAGLVLKGRFFVAYQEKSEVLEVISYNPEAGRFEFQEVRNYGPGQTPSVRYASRKLCLSCHQNAGPIFPTEPWSETDANRNVASRLRAANPLLPTKSVYSPRFDDAWSIDYGTDRATYFSSSQFIWRNGCAVGTDITAGEALGCRAAMLLAALKFRLTGVVQQTQKYKDHFLSIVSRNWNLNWPNGLYIATADIADKDPGIDARLIAEDPLELRGPRAFWSTPKPHLLAGVVAQISEFFSQADIRRLDDRLSRLALERGVRKKDYKSLCKLIHHEISSASRIRFICTTSETSDLGFTASGSLNLEGDRVVDGQLDKLRLRGGSDYLFLSLGDGKILQQGERRSVSLRVKSNNTGLGIKEDTSDLSARLEEGTLLQSVQLSWLKADGLQISNISAEGILSTLDDFAPLENAVENLLNQAINGQMDGLSAKPFRRRVILKALYRELGVAPLKWHQDTMVPQPSSETTTQKVNARNVSSLSSFYQYCSSCHMEADQFPPGFLHGNPEQVKQNIIQCGQQILYRLNLWGIGKEQRPVSPMPPPHWLAGTDMSTDHWRDSVPLKELKSLTQKLMANSNSPTKTTSHSQSKVCLPKMNDRGENEI